MKHSKMETVNTEAEAWKWVYEKVDDPFVDNYRLEYLDVNPRAAWAAYDAIRDSGCCGSFDAKVIIGGREAMIGCNFGH